MTPRFWIMVLLLSAVVIGSSAYLRWMSDIDSSRAGRVDPAPAAQTEREPDPPRAEN